MEFGFIGLIRECGFVEAKFWAESLGIPHEHSAQLLSLLLSGPRRTKIAKADFSAKEVPLEKANSLSCDAPAQKPMNSGITTGRVVR
jgi:hypothetical protein